MEGVFLISGVPGAGKTTVARLLARHFPLGAHIEADEIQNLIVSGGLHPQEQPRAEAHRQLRLRTRNVSLLADTFASAQVVPVIDDTVVDRQRLEDYLADVQTRPLRLVLLSPPLDIALSRDKQRGYKEVGHIWGHLDAVMRKDMVDLGLWLDTSAQTPQETLAAIIARLFRNSSWLRQNCLAWASVRERPLRRFVPTFTAVLVFGLCGLRMIVREPR